MFQCFFSAEHHLTLLKKKTGSGIEANRNATSLKIAALAQPSGISVGIYQEEDVLFFADSESSSIRCIPLSWLTNPETKSSSQTIVGGDPKNQFNLTCFGDTDGASPNARLAHPLGVCFFGKMGLFVADTYNHKIKLIDLKLNQIVTFPLKVALCEPSALAVVEHLDQIFLYVCNTNMRCVEKVAL